MFNKIKEAVDSNGYSDVLPGGKAEGMSVQDIADKHGVPVEQIEQQIKMGIEVEYEHTPDESIATDIAMDHLEEMPDYYSRLAKLEEYGSLDLEGLAAKMHDFYVEAMRSVQPDSFNPDAIKPYTELSDDQKEIDRYVARKIIGVV